MKRKIIGLTLAAILVASAAAAVPRAPHEVYGEITRSGSPASGVEVVLSSGSSSFSATTESDGTYQIRIPYSSGREGTTFELSVDGTETGDEVEFSSGAITRIDAAISTSESPSSGGGSSGGGGGGGGGLGGGLGPQPEQNASEEEVDLRVEPAKFSFRMETNAEKEKEITLENTGGKTVNPEAEVDQGLSEIVNIEEIGSIQAGSTENLQVSFKSRNSTGFYSGDISIEYANSSKTVEAGVQIYRPEPEINTSISRTENNTISYSADVENADLNDKVVTTVYNSEGEVVYSKNYSLENRDSRIQGTIDSELDPGQYRLEARIIGDNPISSSQKFKVVKIKEDRNLFVYILPLALLLGLAGAKIWSEEKKQKEMREKIKKQVSETSKNADEKLTVRVEESEEEDTDAGEIREESVQEMSEPEPGEITELIEEGLENSAPAQHEILKKSLEESRDILSDLQEMDSIPEEVGEKEKEIVKALREEEFSEVNKRLDEIREIIDQIPREEELKYDEIVGKTVREAKEEIKDMEDPDYKKILEKEKERKDRKSLKRYLKRQVDD